MRYETEKLVKCYEEHGKITVGLDFDDTIYPLRDHPFVVKRCAQVRSLIEAVRDKVTLCLWTVAADWSQKYKVTITEELYGIKLDYVNESPLYEDPTVRKPFFNIVLDDNAGLDDAMAILAEFHLHTGNKAL